MPKFRPITLADLLELVEVAASIGNGPRTPITLSIHEDMTSNCPLTVIGAEQLSNPSDPSIKAIRLIAGCASCDNVGENSYTETATVSDDKLASIFNLRKE